MAPMRPLPSVHSELSLGSLSSSSVASIGRASQLDGRASTPTPSLRERISSTMLLSAPSSAARPRSQTHSLKPKASFRRLFKRGAGMPGPPPLIPQYYQAPVPERSQSAHPVLQVRRGDSMAPPPLEADVVPRSRRKRSSTIVSISSLLSFSPISLSSATFAADRRPLSGTVLSVDEFGVPRATTTPNIVIDAGDGQCTLDRERTIRAKRHRQQTAPLPVTVRPMTSASTLAPLAAAFPSPPPSLSASISTSSSPDSLASTFLPPSVASSFRYDKDDDEDAVAGYFGAGKEGTVVLGYACARSSGSQESLCDPMLMAID